MTPLSPDTYERQYWSVLRGTLDSLLHCAPGSFKAISYEQMYSAVYKCVCRQMSERLYEDLTSHLRGALAGWADQMSRLPDAQFVQEFHRTLNQFIFAQASIVPIFTYLNRFYVEIKLQTDLNTEIIKIYTDLVGDVGIHRLLSEKTRSDFNPFSCQRQFCFNFQPSWPRPSTVRSACSRP